MSKDILLDVRNLSVAYRGKRIVREVSFCLRRGEILVIAGESGSGKSTVLKAVQGLLGPAGELVGGEVFFEGEEISRLDARRKRKLSGEKMAMIFQNAGASFCPVRTIGEQIYESVREHKSWSREEFRRNAFAVMERIHLERGVLDEYPFCLSGGMGQRAGLLAAMILSPALLLADEPTSALDTVTQVSVVRELMALRDREGASIAMVTHHMGVAWHMADHILVMRQGEVVESGTKEKIFGSPEKNYTRELIEAVPRIEQEMSA